MNIRFKTLITVLLLANCFLFSCEENTYEQATVTFYPTLAGVATEPATGATGSPVTISVKTSRVLPEESQINVRITGEGAGYGYSYVTNPPMLQPGILTLTIPRGEAGASIEFTPRNDGLFIPENYHYKLTIEQTSKAIQSVGNETFELMVNDNTTPFLSYNFNTCSGTPSGFKEERASGTVMQASVWGCSPYGYPSETTSCAEANAYGKGGSAASNSYLIMTAPIDAGKYSTVYVSALVYSRYTGQGQLKFKYSTNYSGAGNPEAEGVVWTDLTEINNSLPAAGSWQTTGWKPVGALIENVSDGNLYVAIQFAGGTSSSSSSWRIENLEFKGI